MIISDHTMKVIHEKIGPVPPIIIPWRWDQQQPASYDLVLASIDTLGHGENLPRKDGSKRYMISEHEFVLGCTLEEVNIPNNMVARIEGKSSLARMGIMVHTAGFIDPGFCGQLTLEITNHGKPFPLEIGMKIAQLAIQLMDREALRPYGHSDLKSHYHRQKGPTKSWLA